MDDNIKTTYAIGIRAVYRDGDCEFITPDGEIATWFSLEEWIALRAYQDEQRKKGVPIVFPDWDAENSWLSRDHGEIGVYRSSFAVRQEWDQTKRPRIYAFDREHCSAIFTNFRWREGYPKETPNHFDNRLKTITI